MNAEQSLPLAIIKLVVDILTPLVVLVLGIFVSRYLKEMDSRAAFNQALLQRRMKFYDSVSDRLNVLYCYFLYLGNWRETTPPEMISIKRQLDGEFHSGIPYLSQRSYDAYQELQQCCFQTVRGRGTSALICANVAMHREARPDSWESHWDELFVPVDEKTDRASVFSAYSNLVNAFSDDLGAGEKTKMLDAIAKRLHIASNPKKQVMPERESGSGR